MQSLFSHIIAAHQTIRPQVRVTPAEFSPLLSSDTGCQIYLKCEHLQHTGSFKFRGATHKLKQLDENTRKTGVIAASSGNHGYALAYAGKLTNTSVTIYAPATASPVKLSAIRSFGATVELVNGNALDAELAASQQAKIANKPYISPYNDYDVIAGQGTCGLELIEQVPELAAVFVACGGGGLIAGIGTVLKRLSPYTQVIGCWPENARSLHDNLQEGYIFPVDEAETLSDGTAGGIEPDAITFPLCQQVIDKRILVSEQQIQEAMRLVACTDRWMVEGAAGVALAAALKSASEWQDKKVAIVLCGKNIALETYLKAISFPMELR